MNLFEYRHTWKSLLMMLSILSFFSSSNGISYDQKNNYGVIKTEDEKEWPLMVKVSDEFLNKWLIDNDIEGAASFLNSKEKVCIPILSEPGLEEVDSSKGQLVLINFMRKTNSNLKIDKEKKHFLNDYISPIPSKIEKRIGNSINDKLNYSIVLPSESFLRSVCCGKKTFHSDKFFLIAFSFKKYPDSQIFFLFKKEESRWAIHSFDSFRQ